MELQQRKNLFLAGEIRESFTKKSLFTIGFEEWIGFRKIRRGHSQQKNSRSKGIKRKICLEKSNFRLAGDWFISFFRNCKQRILQIPKDHAILSF